MLNGRRVPCRICNPNPYPVEVPPHVALAQVTEVVKAYIQGEQELILNSIAPNIVEVVIRLVGVTEGDGDMHSHPAMSLQGDGLTSDQQREMTNQLQRWMKVFSSLSP